MRQERITTPTLQFVQTNNPHNKTKPKPKRNTKELALLYRKKKKKKNNNEKPTNRALDLLSLKIVLNQRKEFYGLEMEITIFREPFNAGYTIICNWMLFLCEWDETKPRRNCIEDDNELNCTHKLTIQIILRCCRRGFFFPFSSYNYIIASKTDRSDSESKDWFGWQTAQTNRLSSRRKANWCNSRLGHWLILICRRFCMFVYNLNWRLSKYIWTNEWINGRRKQISVFF